MITGVPLVLAKRSRLAAHSRTWAMLPGLESTSSVDIVCMESMTTSSGMVSLMFSKIFSSDVSQRMRHESLSGRSMRPARIFS